MTSHAKTFLVVCRFCTDSRALANPLKWLGLSVQKKICICLNGSGYPCEKNLHLFTRLALSVRKKFASVRTAWAIRAKKVVIHSNGLSFPFCQLRISLELFVTCRLGRSHATNLSKNVNNLIQAS